MSDVFETFCSHLSEAIRRSPYTRAEIADLLGVRPATIKSWCVGRRSPTVQRMLALSELLGVDPGDLFAVEENPSERHECPACGRSFRRAVGYRIHLALRAREDASHAVALERESPESANEQEELVAAS